MEVSVDIKIYPSAICVSESIICLVNQRRVQVEGHLLDVDIMDKDKVRFAKRIKVTQDLQR